MECPVHDVTVDEAADLLRDPYPLFARRRREYGVFRGSVMDWSQTPDSMRPEHLYAGEPIHHRIDEWRRGSVRLQ